MIVSCLRKIFVQLIDYQAIVLPAENYLTNISDNQWLFIKNTLNFKR